MRSSFFFLLLLCSGLRAADSTAHFFVFLDPKPGRPPLGFDSIKEFQASHLVAMDQLYRDKKLAVTGPFLDSAGGEIFVMSAAAEEIPALLQTDPLVRANRFTIGISSYDVIAGKMCDPPELFDLANYPFARLTETTLCSNEYRAKQIAYYQELAKQKKIVFAARMQKDNSVIVIFAQNDLLAPAVHLVKNDPAVRAVAMKYTVRPWTTSAGVFCDFSQ